jgi:hypothetical protein
LSPRDPFSAIFTGIAAYAQFVGRNYTEPMRLAREAIRQRGDFVGVHRVLTPPRAWPKITRPLPSRSWNYAVRSPIFRLPGS